MLNIIGIDPGLTGAVVLLSAAGKILSIQDTPILKVSKGKGTRTVYVESQMAAILESFKNFDVNFEVHCAIENVHSMPKQGVVSVGSFMYGFGLWIGILSAFRIPYTRIEPQAWKKAIGIPPKSEKSESIVRAHQLFPHVSFMKDRGHVDTLNGRADALLLAEVLRRTLVASKPTRSNPKLR